MKYSTKLNPPAEFVDWLEQANEDWKPTYDDLSGVPRQAVVNSLLNEQGHVCCYCGRRLEDDDGHIDHFWPQSSFGATSNEDRSLDYTNFFRSCGPPKKRGTDRTPSTCGDAKGNWFDVENHILPSDPGCEDRFTFGQSGEILVRVANDTAASNMILALALNEHSLNNERSQIIAEVERELAAGIPPEELIGSTNNKDHEGRLPGFGHVKAAYLKAEFAL